MFHCFRSNIFGKLKNIFFLIKKNFFTDNAIFKQLHKIPYLWEEYIKIPKPILQNISFLL